MLLLYLAFQSSKFEPKISVTVGVHARFCFYMKGPIPHGLCTQQHMRTRDPDQMTFLIYISGNAASCFAPCLPLSSAGLSRPCWCGCDAEPPASFECPQRALVSATEQ